MVDHISNIDTYRKGCINVQGGMNYISSDNANNNNVLENYKVQSCPTYNRYTTDHKLFTMM